MLFMRGKFCSQFICITCIFFCFRFVGLSEPVLAEEGNLIAGWKVGQARGMDLLQGWDRQEGWDRLRMGHARGMGKVRGMGQARIRTCKRMA
jgi:hypothetical protein